VEPGSCGSARPQKGYEEKARMRGLMELDELEKYLTELKENGIEIYGAVLVLLSGNPPQVLLERKSCSLRNPWACDVALPGGTIKKGESPLDTALREAWEEAWVFPGYVKPIAFLRVHRTISKPIYVVPIVAIPSGPIDPRPFSNEVDMVFWFYMDILEKYRPRNLRHPRDGRTIRGIEIEDNVILWGLTLRILYDVYESLVLHDDSLDLPFKISQWSNR